MSKKKHRNKSINNRNNNNSNNNSRTETPQNNSVNNTDDQTTANNKAAKKMVYSENADDMNSLENKERILKISKLRLVGMIITVFMAVGIVIVGLILDDKYKKNHRNIEILMADGTHLADIRKENGEIVFDCDVRYMTYVGVVWEEAKKILGEKKLLGSGAKLYTSFENDKFEILSEAAESVYTEIYGDEAVCLADTTGRILATYQKTEEYDDNINYVLAGTSAGSAIKPLSVYGPAIEAGLITWGSIIKDEPLYYEDDEYGIPVPWPSNVSDFGGKDYTVGDAVKYSINTIAAKVLNEYGPERIMDFLEQSFGMDISRERELAETEGTNSILGNLAFGALRNGVTVKDMAGYYQVFANGGYYQAAYAIDKIEIDGKSVYEHTDSMKRVFSEETAYICNRLLKNVLTEGGTGAPAYVEGLDICGKTGTSDGFRDNWFVGFTPEYVCASWCGNKDGRVNSERTQIEIFKRVMESLEHNKTVRYSIPADIREIKICKKTGKKAGADCKDTEVGYFTEDTVPDKCDE